MNSTKLGNAEPATVSTLDIARIRRDGDTQSRVAVSRETVCDYAAQMREGVVFPPVRVWFDGSDYWLSDGFHRIAAMESIGRTSTLAEVMPGNVADAQWDSLCCNATHGKRRTLADLLAIAARALTHPAAQPLSHREIARRLGIPEATFRRILQKLSAPSGADSSEERIVKRNGIAYGMHTGGIGKHTGADHSRNRQKSLKRLESELAAMKDRAGPGVRNILNVVGNWAFGAATPDDCLASLKRIDRDRLHN